MTSVPVASDITCWGSAPGVIVTPDTVTLPTPSGELKVIGALVTALVQGHGGVLVIEGPPGIGKSRLLTEVMALADKSGVRTLFGEAFEYQQTVPFFALFMATLLLPLEVTLVGNVATIRQLGWTDTMQALVLPFGAAALGTFLIR